MCSIPELRADAKREGIAWRDVTRLARELRELERQERGQADEIRQHAWDLLVGSTSGSAPFWRHGFAARYGKRVDDHDYTVIPGYDEIHDSVVQAFGAYEDDEAGFFDFLFSPYEPLLPWWEHCAEALHRLTEMAKQPAAAGEPVDAFPDWEF